MVSPLLGHKANDRLRAVATVIGVGLAWVLIAGAFAPSIGLAADDVFTDTNLLRISLEIPETGIAALRAYRWKREDPNPTNRPKALARVGRLADGWRGSGMTAPKAKEVIEQIQHEANAAGRTINPEHFGLTIGYAKMEELRKAIAEFRKSGKSLCMTATMKPAIRQ